MTHWLQTTVSLPPHPRGFHLVTPLIEERLPCLRRYRVGLAHLFLMHSSASLTINENADPTVRGDFERHFQVMVPERASHYRHDYEGDDDMPAHLKASLLGCALTIPLAEGRFRLGTWQGIYLCEHRVRAAGRQLTVTLLGEHS